MDRTEVLVSYQRKGARFDHSLLGSRGCLACKNMKCRKWKYNETNLNRYGYLILLVTCHVFTVKKKSECSLKKFCCTELGIFRGSSYVMISRSFYDN
ncbi:hypothetical protein OUZ56_030499 [Daphnia magna]|uniref:Uncharacterized protein n=1 Tax=Daphnia magna TaxID=35525 RepID=A0ABQ9ZRH4_9CRUS|nr:hypothetical protein OUZ56_030499 [Daphnia magna]